MKNIATMKKTPATKLPIMITKKAGGIHRAAFFAPRGLSRRSRGRVLIADRFGASRNAKGEKGKLRRRDWSPADAIKRRNAAERMNDQSYYCQERPAELIAEIAEMQSRISNDVFARATVHAYCVAQLAAQQRNKSGINYFFSA